MSEKKQKNAVVTYEILLRQILWNKLAHSPSGNDKAMYWIGKLYRKFSEAQQKLYPIFDAWLTEMGEKFGKKDEKGNLETDGQWPIVRKECVDEFKAAREAFMSQTVDLGVHLLPLEYFSHIQKTPLEMETLEQIADITDEALEPKAQTGFNGGAQGLHAINGGH